MGDKRRIRSGITAQAACSLAPLNVSSGCISAAVAVVADISAELLLCQCSEDYLHRYAAVDVWLCNDIDDI